PVVAIPCTKNSVGLKVDDIDLFEINEEPWLSGHPLGATAARYVAILLHEMKRCGKDSLWYCFYVLALEEHKTRLQVLRMRTKVIEAKIISGDSVGTICAIPRMVISPSDTKLPFKLNRRQFPVQMCFGITINKSQGQALSKMAAAAQNINNTTIRSILLAEKLTGSNFTNWYRNLRIVLRYEKKMKFVEQPIGPAPDPKTADPDTIDKYYKSANLEEEAACLILSSMSPDLQRTLEKYNAFDMMNKLKTMFEQQAKQELFETVKAFYACKQEDG
ncbi:zinc finger, CCHC-type containing protein, partial [Tanacetum coccineum]